MFSIELLQNLFSLQAIVGLLVGTIGGMVVGALPGLSATMAVALLIPVTFTMEPAAGIIMLASVYTSAIYGGSITAILIHTPGTPASAATAMDGYALTKQGKGVKAIGISTVSSMIGGTISAIALLFMAPPLSIISLKFNAPEYFLIAIFGLTIIGSLAGDSMLKGLLAGIFGLSVACIGYDIIYGAARFTYGITFLESGISLVPAMIGLFSLSQVMIQAENIKKGKITEVEVGELVGSPLPTKNEFKTMVPIMIRSTVIGILVGILPGAGGDIGSWVSYNEAKRFSKHKEEFGKGSIEGLCASETANNAVTGGSFIPLLTLGIPGSATAAVMLGGLTMKGLIPGNDLFVKSADIAYAIMFGFLIANILMGVIGLLIAKKVVKVASVPSSTLAPIIVVLSVVGSYAINQNIVDVYVMVIFGVLGYLMRKTGFPPAPVVLALILESMAESGFSRATIMAKKTPLLTYFLKRPICVVLIIMIIFALVAPFIMKRLQHKIAGQSPAADKNSDD